MLVLRATGSDLTAASGGAELGTTKCLDVIGIGNRGVGCCYHAQDFAVTCLLVVEMLVKPVEE